jgi:hypothetical protein
MIAYSENVSASKNAVIWGKFSEVQEGVPMKPQAAETIASEV